MEENRYKILGSTVPKTYFPDCPVQVSRLETLYDRQYDRAVLHAKLCNISEKPLKSVYVSADCFDDAGDFLGSTGEYLIDAAGAGSGAVFAENEDIPLPGRNAASVRLSIPKLVFEGGEVLRFENAVPADLPEQTRLTGAYPYYAQLVRECRAVASPSFIPDRLPGVARCACGALNLPDYKTCNSCGIDRAWYDRRFDPAYLEEENRKFEEARFEAKCAPIYEQAKNLPKTAAGMREAANKFWSIADYKDASALAEACEKEAAVLEENEKKQLAEKELSEKKALEARENARLQAIYDEIKLDPEKQATKEEYLGAARKMKELNGFSDSSKLSKLYENKAKAIGRAEKNAVPKDDRLSRYTRTEYAEHVKRVEYWRRNIIISLICLAATAALIAGYYFAWYKPHQKKSVYDEAIKLLEKEDYAGASASLKELGDYRDCKEQLEKISLALTNGERTDATVVSADDVPYFSLSSDGALSLTSGYKLPAETKIPDFIDLGPLYKIVEVKTIADKAFSGSKTVKTVVLPGSLTKIGASAFRGCEILETIDFGACRKLTSVGEGAFAACAKLGSVSLPDTLKTLPVDVFNGCASLKSVVLPKDLHEIPMNAFYRCNSLSTVVIPEKVTTVAPYAFFECSAIETLVLPSGVKIVGNHAFESCSMIKEITFGASLEKVDVNAFFDCPNLETVHFAGENFKSLVEPQNNDDLLKAKVVK